MIEKSTARAHAHLVHGKIKRFDAQFHFISSKMLTYWEINSNLVILHRLIQFMRFGSPFFCNLFSHKWARTHRRQIHYFQLIENWLILSTLVKRCCSICDCCCHCSRERACFPKKKKWSMVCMVICVVCFANIKSCIKCRLF